MTIILSGGDFGGTEQTVKKSLTVGDEITIENCVYRYDGEQGIFIGYAA